MGKVYTVFDGNNFVTNYTIIEDEATSYDFVGTVNSIKGARSLGLMGTARFAKPDAILLGIKAIDCYDSNNKFLSDIICSVFSTHMGSGNGKYFFEFLINYFNYSEVTKEVAKVKLTYTYAIKNS